MREPPEVTHLRETLPRSHAIEAFRHLRGHDPDHDSQLESFIEEYVREAYSDGVENWDDLEAPREPITRRAMNAPIGKKLAQAGYSSLWQYFESNGFNDLEKLKADLEFPTLAPMGFTSYVKEVAEEDGNWRKAFRALIAYSLNNITPEFPPSFISLMPIHRIASEFPKELDWVQSACDEIIKTAETTDGYLTQTFNWDDEWLLEVIAKYTTQTKST